MTVHLIVTTKKWLCHTEHIRNESLESLEMDTTLNYQTFQNPELWSAGPFHGRERNLDVGFALDFVESKEYVA
jgi:hypothetical protein